MTPLESYIRERLQRKKLLLMTHTVVGYPSLEANMAMLEAMQRADADLVELQMPFSEPIADGPAFLHANQQALESGIGREQYFTFIQRAAARFDFKLLMMGYYNSVLQMGHAPFCACLAEHGGSGFILADLPPEEANDLYQQAETYRLAPIMLMTPTTPIPRLHHIAQHARGFVYCVARKGVTGLHTDLDQSLEAFVARCRQATSLPLALGFGLQTGADLRHIQGLVDIGVVGTALLTTWEQGGAKAYETLLQELRAATA
ncbi:MAG TPA: tryptophan synthase subunit alpha [Candidatus Tectomicrobia bacterium]|jgi:tryptophan synthase alpha chain